MLQQLFHFHVFGREVPIYGYGLMLVIGFLLGAHLAKYLARRCGLDGELFINASLLALVTGIIGARLSHILENFDSFLNSPNSLREMVNLTSGGLTYYGGFLLAFPALVLYALWKKIPVRLGMDIIAPCLMIGLGFGRIGCFLNGCCYGAPCNLPWAVTFPYHSIAYMDELKDHQNPRPADSRLVRADNTLLDYDHVAALPDGPNLLRHERSLPLHPAQLYSTLTSLLLAALLLAYFAIPHIPGRVFALMLILEGATRYLLEMLRVEPAVLGPMSLSMLLGVGLVILGLVLWWLFGRMNSDGRNVDSPVL